MLLEANIMSNPHTLVEQAGSAMGNPEPVVLLLAAAEYNLKKELLVAAMNSRMNDWPGIDALVGRDNRTVMNENHWHHAKFMLSLLHDYRPALLVNTVIWVFKAYTARGFKPGYWDVQLDCWLEVLSTTLSPESLAVLEPVYRFLRLHTSDFARLAS